MRTQVQSLASLSGLRIQRSCELRHSSQTQLGSGGVVAVAQARGYSSDLTPSLGTSICQGCGPKKAKTKTKKQKTTRVRQSLDLTQVCLVAKTHVQNHDNMLVPNPCVSFSLRNTS